MLSVVAWSVLSPASAQSIDVTLDYEGAVTTWSQSPSAEARAIRPDVGEGQDPIVVEVQIEADGAPTCTPDDGLATCVVALKIEVCRKTTRKGRERKPVCGTQARTLSTAHRTGFDFGTAPREGFEPVSGMFGQGARFTIGVRWTDPVRTHWAAWTRQTATAEAYQGFLDRWADECAAYADVDCTAFAEALNRPEPAE